MTYIVSADGIEVTLRLFNMIFEIHDMIWLQFSGLLLIIVGGVVQGAYRKTHSKDDTKINYLIIVHVIYILSMIIHLLLKRLYTKS